MNLLWATLWLPERPELNTVYFCWYFYSDHVKHPPPSLHPRSYPLTTSASLFILLLSTCHIPQAVPSPDNSALKCFPSLSPSLHKPCCLPGMRPSRPRGPVASVSRQPASAWRTGNRTGSRQGARVISKTQTWAHLSWLPNSSEGPGTKPRHLAIERKAFYKKPNKIKCPRSQTNHV